MCKIDTKKNVVTHVHKEGDLFSKEVALSNLNSSVGIKSSDSKDSIKDLCILGLQVLRELQNMDKE